MCIPQSPCHAPGCCKMISNKKFSLWDQNQLSSFGHFCVHSLRLMAAPVLRDLGGDGFPLRDACEPLYT